MLLDTASLYFRAFYGLPDSLRTPDGQQVNAVRGLLDFIARFVDEYAPTHLVCCWDDNWRPSWRVALLPSYKTHRVAEVTEVSGEIVAEATPDGLEHQVPWIREVLAAVGIPVLGTPDHEADDVIGTLATRGAAAGGSVDVVTGDRDLFQLVADQIRVLYVARGVAKHERVDDEWLAAKYGVIGAQYVDLAVMRGDPSDGIPGVSGIGEKGAAGLLAQYGTLDEIIAAAADGRIRGAKAAHLAAAQSYLDVAPEVVRVRRDLPVDPEWDELALPAAPEGTEWDALVERLGLGGSAQRLAAALAAQG